MNKHILYFSAQVSGQDHYWAARSVEQIDILLGQRSDVGFVKLVQEDEAQKARIKIENDILGDLVQDNPVYLGRNDPNPQ